MLIVIGGLPATGKTTVSRLLAQARGATYLRIDTIEQAVRSAGVLKDDIGPAGYIVAYRLAEENLRLGRFVIADCVNPLAVTRAAWAEVGRRVPVPVLQVELICSDVFEHRRRAEERVVDVPGLVPPNWEAIRKHAYAPWPDSGLVFDTARLSPEAVAAALGLAIDRLRDAQPG